MRDARLERGFSFVVGIVAMLAMRPHAPAPLITQRVPIAIPVAMPRVLPVLVPSIVAAVGPAPLDCPTPPRADDAPIGAAITAREVDYFYDGEAPDKRAQVVASARAAVLAVRMSDGHVRVSDDDGRSFRVAFHGAQSGSIAVDDRGRVYATIDGALAVRDERGRERSTPPFSACGSDDCSDRVATAGDTAIWIRDHEVRTSRDGGRHWRALAAADASDLIGKPRVLGLGGTLYGIEHVDSDCGYSADQVAKIDLATGASTSSTFSNDTDQPQLDVRDDAGATWRYAGARELILGRVAPAAGGRVLFVHEHQLAELCGAHARAIAFAYDADRIDAVDAAGRALITIEDRVFRFSPRWGWRELRVSDQRVSDSDAP
jgi:hypothetical protein